MADDNLLEVLASVIENPNQTYSDKLEDIKELLKMREE